MSAQALVPPLAEAELPDWILALKPATLDADDGSPADSAVFVGLDTELEELLHAHPEDITWLAETANQPPPPVSRVQAELILEGQLKPAPIVRPRPKRRRRGLNQSERLALDLMMLMMIAALIMMWVVLRYAMQLP
jgi:hypothetical protein